MWGVQICCSAYIVIRMTSLYTTRDLIVKMGNAHSTPFYQQLEEAVEVAKSAEKLTDEQYAAAKKEITDFQDSIDQLKKLAPGNQMALSIASAAARLLNLSVGLN